MLITHTERERVPRLPRFRLVTVSMERLQMGTARLAVISMALIDLDPVVMLAAHPPRATTPAWLFQPRGQSQTDARVASLSRAPVHPIALRGTTVAVDLAMPGHGPLAVGQEASGVRVRGGGGKGQTGASPMPGPLDRPCGGCLWVSPAGPAAQRGPGEVSEPVGDGVADAGAVGVRPAPDCGGALGHHLPLRPGLPAWPHPPQRRPMVLDVGLGGGDQGGVPQAPRAPGAWARLVVAPPILPDVTPQQLPPGRIAFQGVTDAAFGCMPRQAHLRPPRPAPLLTRLAPLAVFVEHHALIGRGDAPGLRGPPGDGLIHAMPGQHGSERRTPAALWRPCGGGHEGILFPDARFEPGVALPTPDRCRRRFGHQSLRIEAVAAWRDLAREPVVRPKPETVAERANGLVAGAARAQARGMRRPLGVPGGFQGLAPEGVPCPCLVRGHPAWALCSPSTLGDPEAAPGWGLPLETQGVGQSPPSRWREGVHAVQARGLCAAGILAAPTHRQPPGLPGLPPHLLKVTGCPDLCTWRRLVPPFLEAEARPLPLLPRPGVPGPLQGRTRCGGASPLTQGFPWQETGPTSASPGHAPWPWLLRTSSSPAAAGWPLRREGTGLTEGHGRVRRSPFPWLASGGRCAPPGCSAVRTGQSRRLPAPYPVPLWLQRVRL